MVKLLPGVCDREVVAQFDADGVSTISGGGNFSAKTFLIAQMLVEKKEINNVLWVVSNYQEKEQVLKFAEIWGGRHVNCLDLQQNDVMSENIARKNKIDTMYFLSKIKSGRKGVFIVEYTDMIRLYPEWEDVSENSAVLKKGADINTMEFFGQLIDMGYEVADDKRINKGEYFKSGEVFLIYPVNSDKPLKIDIGFDEIEKISYYDMDGKEALKEVDEFCICPVGAVLNKSTIFEYFSKKDLFIEDELEIPDENLAGYDSALKKLDQQVFKINFTSFMEDTPYHHHLHYLSVLKYQNLLDFV